MKTTDSIGELAKALAKAQGSFVPASKSKDGHGYKYATLDGIIEAVREPLSTNGLAFVQLPTKVNDGQVGLVTRLMHESGEWLEDVTRMPMAKLHGGGGGNPAQVYGATLTYARRYALSAMLGIATEEDTDGMVRQNGQQRRPKPTAKPAPKPQAKQKANGNGLDLDARVADMRAAVEGVSPPTLGEIATSAAATTLYSHQKHAMNALCQHEMVAEKVEAGKMKCIPSQRVSKVGALTLFDWLIERKQDKQPDFAEMHGGYSDSPGAFEVE